MPPTIVPMDVPGPSFLRHAEGTHERGGDDAGRVTGLVALRRGRCEVAAACGGLSRRPAPDPTLRLGGKIRAA